MRELPLYSDIFLKKNFISLNDRENIILSEREVLIPKFETFVSCGLFGVSDDFISGYQSLDERFIKNKTTTFFFIADGESMSPTINKGNILLVDRSLTAIHGSICIFCFEGQLICKRLIKTRAAIILRSDNSLFRDIVVGEGIDVEIWGVVISRHEEFS